MLERLKYRVLHVSSEEVGFAGSELERHGPTVNGWRSNKAVGMGYPLEIILQLETRSRLGHMQLLTHQYLIPEMIELYIGESLEDSQPTSGGSISQLESLEKIKYVLLGNVKMTTNLNTAFKVRELKSISMECSGTFIKIMVYQNYINKYNPYNQVALVAINVLGEKLDEELAISGSLGRISFHETTQSDRDRSLFSPYDDLAFTMYVDNEVQDLIRKMDLKKQEAVLDERFDFASKLKATIEHLRKSGEVLAKYQLEKQIAAAREDFQRAKEKKIQMDSYRENLYKSFRIRELLEPTGRLAENDIPGKINGIGMGSMGSLTGNGTSPTVTTGMTRSLTDLPPPSTISAVSTPESTTSERFSSSLLTTPDTERRQESGYYSNDEPKFPPPLYVKKRKPTDRIERELKEERRELLGQAASVHAPTIHVCRPSNLSERAKRYAALPISVFGDTVVEKIFSKNFAVKEDGIRNLQKALSDYKRGDKNNPPTKILRSAVILLQRTIKDTIFSVFNLTIQVLIYLFDDFCKKHRLAASEMSQGLERMVPELLSKSGDSALGKNKIAMDCILRLQACQHIRALHVLSTHLTKPFDTPLHPRLAQSKAEMVEHLLLTYGIFMEKNMGMTARDYVEFGVSAFNQPSESVRRIAERILVQLYQNHSRLVRQHLPLEEDISPKNIQYRQLFQQFDKVDLERGEGASTISAIMKDSKSMHSMTSSVYVPKFLGATKMSMSLAMKQGPATFFMYREHIRNKSLLVDDVRAMILWVRHILQKRRH